MSLVPSTGVLFATVNWMVGAAGPAGGVTYTVIGYVGWVPWSLWAGPVVTGRLRRVIGSPMEPLSALVASIYTLIRCSLRWNVQQEVKANAIHPSLAIIACLNAWGNPTHTISGTILSRTRVGLPHASPFYPPPELISGEQGRSCVHLAITTINC